MNITKSIKTFQAIIPSINAKYRAYANRVIELFKDRKIEKTKEAEKLLYQLGSRGKAPQSAIKKITEHYSKAEPATGKLNRSTSQNFFISGDILTVHTYNYQLKKTGAIKGSEWERPWRLFPFAPFYCACLFELVVVSMNSQNVPRDEKVLRCRSVQFTGCWFGLAVMLCDF